MTHESAPHKNESSSDDREVAERLITIRQEKGLSQRKLAKLSGVGSGTISQIESSSMQPSVALLKKILGAIDVSMGEFFNFDLAEKDKIFYRKNELRDLGTQHIHYWLVAAQKKNRKIQMLIEEFAVGADSGRSMFSHEGEECGVVIEGKLELIVQDQMRILGPGDAYYFDSHLPHHFRNVGNVPCKLISACTPSSF